VKTAICIVAGFLFLQTAGGQTRPGLPDSAAYGFSVSAGMGPMIMSGGDIAHFVNNLQPGAASDYFTAAEFYVSVDAGILPDWLGRAEYSYMVKTFNVSAGFGAQGDLTLELHEPTLLADYRIIGRGYFVRFGGGMGWHYARFAQNFSGRIHAWRASGPGIKLEASFNAELSEHLYCDVNGELRSELMGKFRDEHDQPFDNGGGADAEMSGLGAGFRIGLMYTF
jgi:hypothetical protein